MCDPGTIIVDDSNPLELAKFCLEKDVDLFIGGVKERPIAYKLGIGFCDHNHERKEPLAGFVGMLNFAREVYSSVASPVWQFAPRREKCFLNGRNGVHARFLENPEPAGSARIPAGTP
jgi:nitrogenase molybdenum-cofactor synthesis protein NifE